MLCDTAADPGEALAVLRAGAVYDVAVLAMHIPGMDGRALVAAVRALPGGRQLPLCSSRACTARPSAAPGHCSRRC